MSTTAGRKKHAKGGSPYKGIPREEIPWYPSIDEEKCTACGTCADFCHNSVYSIKDKARVTNPFGCVVGCTGCLDKCPEGAISFPKMKEFVKVIQKVKAEHASGKR